ncbi:hypothetical protein [Actinomadura flavalba]|uniref:hypothetical protein n=1 Tax=Actinomadura flavalba TaxID=1120938 RepID=UPI0003684083|nr:hypothetical protein [Actinomadura flavalba]
MQKRSTNVILTTVTGSALAAMLVAGVAVASGDDAPQNTPANSPAAGGEAAPKAQGEKRKGESHKDAKKNRKKNEKKALLSGKTTASYFWDDGSGINGDTGAPAGGKPMQKGLFASPSWPLHTKVKVSYNGRSVEGFIGDRGPGKPSHRGIMLDLDTYTFRYLLDGKKPESKYHTGGSAGHLKGLKYEVLEWGKGAGKKGQPRPFGSG